MKSYIERNKKQKGQTEVTFYNCRLCPAPLMTESERSNGICNKCTDQPIEFTVVEKTPSTRVEKRPLPLGKRPHQVTRMKDAALQNRIDAVVQKAKAQEQAGIS